MKQSEILELVRAGFTKEEIEKMGKDETEEAPKEKEETPEQVPEKPADEVEKKDDRIDELVKAVASLKEDLRKHAVLSDDYQVKDPQDRAKEILASIINPLDKKQ